MKVLVYQVRIKDSYYGGNEDPIKTKGFSEFEKKLCIPSVQAWAKRCGYDYKMYTESTFPNNGYFENEYEMYSAERLMHLYCDEYDYRIYVDVDIFVHPKAQHLPLIDGISLVPENYDREEIFFKYFNINKRDYNYFNAGVYSIDMESGKKLFDYSMNRIENIKNRTFYADQGFLNEYQLVNGNKHNVLDSKWNFLLPAVRHMDSKTLNDPINELDLQNKLFFHFAGITKHDHKFWFKQIKDVLKLDKFKLL